MMATLVNARPLRVIALPGLVWVLVPLVLALVSGPLRAQGLVELRFTKDVPSVRARVESVDFAARTLSYTAKGQPQVAPFDALKAQSLARAVAERLPKGAEALYEFGVYLQHREAFREALKLYSLALKGDAGLTASVSARRSEVVELQAWDALDALPLNDQKARRIALKSLIRRYRNTVAGREAEALLASLPVREPRAANRTSDAPKPSAALTRVRQRANDAERVLREGFEAAATRQDSSVARLWEDGLKRQIEPGLAEIARQLRRPTQPSERATFVAEKKRLDGLRLKYFKALIHYWLMGSNFSKSREFLSQALQYNPADREVLRLQLLYDDLLPLTQSAANQAAADNALKNNATGGAGLATPNGN